MKIESAKSSGFRAATLVTLFLAIAGLAGCADSVSAVDRAQAKVTAKEKALSAAQTDMTTASEEFCATGEIYIEALDRYGDVLNATAPTVGDVRVAGADLSAPQEDVVAAAEAAASARQAVAVAEQELADARTALAEAEASGSAVDVATETPSTAPPASSASIERVTQAEAEFADAQNAVIDSTPLPDAAELFNSAAVALEVAWLRLFADAGCLSDEQAQRAAAAVTDYTMALQQDLTDAGLYAGAIDGIYGPQTVQAVQDLQTASGLPATGTVDKATADALRARLVALGGAAAQESVATTAAVQQTLKLVGFWDGPVDGVWTPELTEAVTSFQVELGVEPTGTVDVATVSAFQDALAELQQEDPTLSPSPAPTTSEGP